MRVHVNNKATDREVETHEKNRTTFRAAASLHSHLLSLIHFFYIQQQFKYVNTRVHYSATRSLQTSVTRAVKKLRYRLCTFYRHLVDQRYKNQLPLQLGLLCGGYFFFCCTFSQLRSSKICTTFHFDCIPNITSPN